MSKVGAAPVRAATPVSHARAEASRRNGAKSRGPKSAEGKARAAKNALKHGLRAQKFVVLPDEDAAEFAALEAALLEELAPVGALQAVLARQVAIAAWRLARADRMEVELFAERRWDQGGVGVALIRDGNGTRSFETLMRYRSAAMAEFMRSLRTLKALQAQQAGAAPAARPTSTRCLAPNEPERLLETCSASRPSPSAPCTGRPRRRRVPNRTNPSLGVILARGPRPASAHHQWTDAPPWERKSPIVTGAPAISSSSLRRTASAKRSSPSAVTTKLAGPPMMVSANAASRS